MADRTQESSRLSPCTADTGADAPRVIDANRLRTIVVAGTFNLDENRDDYSRGWTHAMTHVLRELGLLPVPTYSCAFPTDDVSRGLRELRDAPAVTFDTTDVDFEGLVTCACQQRGCSGCAPGRFEIGGKP